MGRYAGCDRRAAGALRCAARQAGQMGAPLVCTEHLLLALARTDTTQAGEVLVQRHAFGYTLARALAEHPPCAAPAAARWAKGLSQDLAACIERARADAAQERRRARGRLILERLCALGADARPYLAAPEAAATRVHIALALVSGGFAADVKDAFARYIGRGAPAYVALPRPAPARVIALISGAGGIPVLAHPCHLKGDVHAIVRELCALGLRGIEAYYPTSTPGQTELFLSLAAQHGLLVTCGSDFHGDHRPAARLGCAYRDDPALERTRKALLERL